MLLKAFIPLPQDATAVYTSSGLAYYRHPDHLGSSRLATTRNQTLYSSTAYAPFGETYLQTGTTDVSFTGIDQDMVSGIHDFLFRKYPPVQGRWLSPDPAGLAVVDPTNPQSWNRYAYVNNNPLAAIDPLGLDSGNPCDDPWYAETHAECPAPPCAAFGTEGCIPFPPGYPGSGGGGGGSAPSGGTSAGSQPPSGETLGLPGGLNPYPFGNVWNLFGFLPGMPNPWILDARNVIDNGELVWVGDYNGEPGGCQTNGICVLWDAVLGEWVEDPSTENAMAVLGAAYNATVHGLGCVGMGWAVQGTAMAGSAPIMSKPFSAPGSSGGTSVASSLAGDFLGSRMFAPVGMPGTSTFRWTTTANWGRAAGRWLPFIGTAVGVYAINSCLGG
ncbi:MAG: RHS repeat-associated core domain-containing protein [Acidobacteria bacterium]|nr:RHS repeat-associated core domain-containing protein [Acidobacteriota bacterium]